MTGLVTPVADALRAACLAEFGTNWNNDVAAKFASAAIAAMREPDATMVEAGYDAAELRINSVMLRKIWRAMVDAAAK